MPSFMRQINVIGRCSAMVRNQKLADTGLTGWHYSYILTLCRNPGQSQEHLARHIYINKSNVTRHLTQLEKNGYVERRQSEEDKRVMLVYPTEKAYEVLPRVREVVPKPGMVTATRSLRSRPSRSMASTPATRARVESRPPEMPSRAVFALI